MSKSKRPRSRAPRKPDKGKAAELQRRLDEALAREAASAEILSSIRGSAESAQPVFDAIVRNLRRLFGTAFANVLLARDGKVEIAAAAGDTRFVAGMRAGGPMPLEDEDLLTVRAIRRAQVLRLCPVIGNPDAPPKTERLARKSGFNSVIAAPMLRDGVAIGAIATARRQAVPFGDEQVALIKSFADQAVIAIENARLFNETKEALEQQTATSEILRVMSSSPSDVQPVFDAVAQHRRRDDRVEAGPPRQALCLGRRVRVADDRAQAQHLRAPHGANREQLLILEPHRTARAHAGDEPRFARRRGDLDLAVAGEEHGRERGAEKPLQIADDRIQDGLRALPGASDGSEDLGARRLARERFVEPALQRGRLAFARLARRAAAGGAPAHVSGKILRIRVRRSNGLYGLAR